MSGELTMGVEEEFFLVGSSGQLVQRAPAVLRATDRADVDLKQELLACQVESATEVCKTASELYRELRDLRERLRAGAARHDARLAASGTIPHQQEQPLLVGQDSRYLHIADHYGRIVVNRMICGCHVHVGVPDRATGIAVSNFLRPWLPVLLALSANSPFLDGEDTGYSSTRQVLYGRWPTAGPPPYLASVDQYESIIASLLDTSVALDRKMIYWDIRPSESQPTVEIRIADVLGTAREATLLAVLVRTLVGRAMDLIADGRQAPRVPSEVIRAQIWRAAKHGLTGRVPDPNTGRKRPAFEIIDELVRTNSASLEANGELGFVKSTLDWLGQAGGSADRQRAAYARRGRFDDVLDVIAG